jgi:hypothetical protein
MLEGFNLSYRLTDIPSNGWCKYLVTLDNAIRVDDESASVFYSGVV